jgi:prepilin-type N-terminal cleavage/methylation domain-containing protein
VTTLATRERLLKDERGFTLPEMLITITIMGVVFSAFFSVFDMSLTIFSYGNNKVEAAENARVGLEKMEREIRQVHAINTATGQMFDTWASTQIRFGNLGRWRYLREGSRRDTPGVSAIGLARASALREAVALNQRRSRKPLLRGNRRS